MVRIESKVKCKFVCEPRLSNSGFAETARTRIVLHRRYYFIKHLMEEKCCRNLLHYQLRQYCTLCIIFSYKQDRLLCEMDA